MSELIKQRDSLQSTKNLILKNVLRYTPEKKEKYLVMFNDLIIDINKEIKKAS